MPRSIEITKYSETDRAILTNEYFDALPRLINGFQTLKDAQRTYFRILAILRAGAATGNNEERINAANIGVRQPTETRTANPANPANWAIEIYSKNAIRADDPLANDILSACGKLPSSIGRAAAQPRNEVAATTPPIMRPSPPIMHPSLLTADDSPLEIDHKKNEEMMRLAGILSPDEKYNPEEWVPTPPSA